MAIPFESRQGGSRQDRSPVGSNGTSIHALTSKQDSSRRRFLQTAATGAVSGLVALACMEFTPRQALAQSKLSPDAALQELMNGNQRFTSGRLTSFEEDLAILKQNTVEKQEPFAAVLSCADSRVPVELIFDQSIGHIFGKPCRRQYCYIGDHRQSRIWSVGATYKGNPGDRARRLRRSEGDDSSEGSSRTDQRALSAYPASGRSGWIKLGGSDQGECQDSGGSSTRFLYRNLGVGQRKQAEGCLGVYRPRKRSRDAIGVGRPESEKLEFLHDQPAPFAGAWQAGMV